MFCVEAGYPVILPPIILLVIFRYCPRGIACAGIRPFFKRIAPPIAPSFCHAIARSSPPASARARGFVKFSAVWHQPRATARRSPTGRSPAGRRYPARCPTRAIRAGSIAAPDARYQFRRSTRFATRCGIHRCQTSLSRRSDYCSASSSGAIV